MHSVSLFTDVGGFDLGFERAGIEPVAQVEKDRHCNAVCGRHWPHILRFGDIKNVGRHNLPAVDLVCGGFPCQDLSVAGKRTGLAGERSGLWYEFLRVVAELMPRWVVVENVPGLLSSNGGSDFAIILRGLVECGYGVAWRVFDSQYAGVPQRRRRVFIVGHLGDGRAAEVLFERESRAWDFEAGQKQGTNVAGTLAAGTHASGFNGQDAYQNKLIANAISTRPAQRMSAEDNYVIGTLSASGAGTARTGDGNEASKLIVQNVAMKGYGVDVGGNLCNALRSSQGGGDKPYVFNWQSGGDVRLNVSDQNTSALGTTQTPAVLRQGVRRLMPVECERLQGFPDDWTRYGVVPAGLEMLNAGYYECAIAEDYLYELSDSARYRMMGNAVTVNVIEWIGKRILDLS